MLQNMQRLIIPEPNSPLNIQSYSPRSNRRSSKLSIGSHRASDRENRRSSKLGNLSFGKSEADQSQPREERKIFIENLGQSIQNKIVEKSELGSSNQSFKLENKSKYDSNRFSTEIPKEIEDEGEEDEEEMEERLRMEKLMHYIEVEVLKRMDIEKERFIKAIDQIYQQNTEGKSEIKGMNEYVTNLHSIIEQFQNKIEVLVAQLQQKYIFDFQKLRSENQNIELKYEFILDKLNKIDYQMMKEDNQSNISFTYNNLLHQSFDSRIKPSTANNLRNLSTRRILSKQDPPMSHESPRFINNLKSKIKKKNMSNFIVHELQQKSRLLFLEFVFIYIKVYLTININNQ